MSCIWWEHIWMASAWEHNCFIVTGEHRIQMFWQNRTFCTKKMFYTVLFWLNVLKCSYFVPRNIFKQVHHNHVIFKTYSVRTECSLVPCDIVYHQFANQSLSEKFQLFGFTICVWGVFDKMKNPYKKKSSWITTTDLLLISIILRIMIYLLFFIEIFDCVCGINPSYDGIW